MSFFKRHPRLWLAVWALFGLGSLLVAFNALFDHGFDAVFLVKGLIGTAISGMMIAYILPEVRTKNAQH